MMDRDELALAKLDNSALLEGRDTRGLVSAALGYDAMSYEGIDENGFYVETLGEKLRTAGRLRDLAERYKRGEFEDA